MIEDDILAQLRDIHLPAELDTVATSGFAAWPFAVLALVVLTILLSRLWVRNRWRRSARADLARILSIADPGTQWTRLLTFAAGLSRRSGRPVSLPDTAFARPATLSDEQRAEFVAYLGAELRR